jgi:hypothetical protein
MEYQWRELPGPRFFRLLQLLSYDDAGLIAFSLEPTEIDASPDYTAISYSWGKRVPTHKALCNGKHVPLTASVHALFTHLLGNHEASKTIWIDALCIDQRNPSECAQQVRLMKDIFSRASLTIVWLGEPNEPSLVPSMIQLGEKIIDMTKSVSTRRLASEEFEKYGLPPIEDLAWKMLANLFCLPWFERVWIAQEYILARKLTFLYGSHWQSHSYYVDICRTLPATTDSYYLEETLRPLVSPKQTLNNFYSNSEPGRWLGISQRLSFLETLRSLRARNNSHQQWVLRLLLRRTSTSRTTDLRDHIFGLLGILPEDVANHRDLQPDYQVSHEVAYAKLARYVLEKHGLATLLFSSGFPRFAISKPSWVPDWSQQKLGSVMLRKAGQNYPSSYGSDETAPWRLDGNAVPEKLFVRGYIFGTVEIIESMLELGRNNPSAPYQESQWQFVWNTMLLMADSAHAGEPTAALALRHLSTLCQADPPRLAYDAGYVTVAELGNISQIVAPLYNSKNLQPLTDDPEMQRQIGLQLGRINVSDTSMGFCRTNNGEIGRVPHEAAVNDLVCFFQGIDIPFVVRESTGSSSEYSLIDHCYIDGQMGGKFWQAHKPEDTKEICLV